MKPEIRILGIDDSPFDTFSQKRILVIGTVFRGGTVLDGVMSTTVAVDGTDATKKLIEMINKSKFKPQLRCVILDGIALGGFNVIDIHALHKKTKIPVMVVIRKYPDLLKIKTILTKLKKEKAVTLIEKAGAIHKAGNIYIQIKGMTLKAAEETLKITCTRSYLPEPIRAAHIIAAGVVKGESKGRA